MPGARAKDWHLYILRCGDGSLYTGIAKDVDARRDLHNSGKGAAYTRSRLPVKVVYRAGGLTRSKALKKEFLVKALSRPDKLRLVRERGPLPRKRRTS